MVEMKDEFRIECWVCKDGNQLDQWQMEVHFRDQHIPDSNTVTLVGLVFEIQKILKNEKRRCVINGIFSVESNYAVKILKHLLNQI